MRVREFGLTGLVTALLAGCVSHSQSEEPAALDAEEPPTQIRNADQIALGEQVFFQCRICHVASRGSRSTAGPNLYGVWGRRAGGLDNYPYSGALASSNVTWDAVTLDAFLADPSDYIPGSDMAEGTVRNGEHRAALIAYIETLQD